MALPASSSAEVQKFVCAVARHMHSKGMLCSFEMPVDLEQAGAVRVFLERSRRYERPDQWVFCSHRLANYSLAGFEWNNRAPVEPSCSEKRQAELSLHARCLAAVLPVVPRWGAKDTPKTELEKVACQAPVTGARQTAPGVAPGAGSATVVRQCSYPVHIIASGRVMLIDKPPTQDSGSKDSFEQDKQQLVPQGAQLQETEAERAARERAFERDYAQARVKWGALAKD